MKADTHPEYKLVQVVCSCGNQFPIRSTYRAEVMRIDVCKECHPFYTGKHKIVDTTGRVDLFKRRYGSYNKDTTETAPTRERG